MRFLAYLVLRARRFTFEGRAPDAAKFIILGAPHTSSWDFIVFLATTHYLRIRAGFLGKHTLFRWPFGRLMRRLGGIPVQRDRPGSVAQDAADAFNEAERMALVVAPEGTRSGAPSWKSGFYRIAMAANVPVVPAFVDLPHRRLTVGPTITLTGSPGEDMNRIRGFYAAAGAAEHHLKAIWIHEQQGSGDDA
jgi:1-acyl-sn-glycerol-3-phosphate acyltransferase